MSDGSHTPGNHGNPGTGDLTLLAATLQQLHQAGQLSVDRAAHATGIAESSIYRWISGDTDPQFTRVLLLFKHSGVEVQRELLSLLAGSTPWVFALIPDNLDINGDGMIDTDDAMDSVIAAVEVLARELKELRSAGRDGKITDSERAHLDERANIAVQGILAAKRIIAHLNEQTRQRSKCRPLVVSGLTSTGRVL